MKQLELWPQPAGLVVDGMTPKPGITLWGRATKNANGKWECLADVLGNLCRVELNITSSQLESS